MDSLAYLHLALAYQDPTSTERVLRKSIQQFWQQLLAKPISSRFILRLLSLGVALTILTLAQAALALLQRGDSGPEVFRLQQNLQQLGFYLRPLTGEFDWATEQAVLNFQRAAGIGVDGIVGQNTELAISQRLVFPNQAAQLPWNTLPPASPITGYNPSVPPTVNFGDNLPGQLTSNQQSWTINRTLRRGDQGLEVQLLQSRLADLRFYFGSIDGIYGQQTESAVYQFQLTRGLFPNGIADAETLQALDINPGTGGDPLFVRVTLKGYVVVIPTGNNAVVAQVQSSYPSAIPARNRRGRFMYMGDYPNRAEAERQSAVLRSQGFTNARVVYFR